MVTFQHPFVLDGFAREVHGATYLVQTEEELMDTRPVAGMEARFDGDPITVSAVGGPAHGSTTLVTAGPNAGRISYLPGPNFVGTDVFTYTITDGHGGTATATVSVTVTAGQP